MNTEKGKIQISAYHQMEKFVLDFIHVSESGDQTIN